jgi:GcrA cell cycle regulator
MSWTDERVVILTKLWADGFSASEIADKFGDVSRNAVIGKVTRLGLSGGCNPVQRVRAAPPKPRPEKPKQIKLKPKLKALAFGHKEALVAPPINGISLVDLNENTCRWPHGHPGQAGFSFCGGHAVSGLPYCAHHCRIAYLPVTRKNDPLSNVAG